MDKIIKMDSNKIRNKFGGDFRANNKTFVMGIDRRITQKIAQRFRNKNVLETCTGAGFTTISLAKVAEKVTTVEICSEHQDQAKVNVERCGLLHNVNFVLGDVLNTSLLNSLGKFDAAFLDPDWCVTGANYNYKFRNSNMQPPADKLLHTILEITKNAALILPPQIPINELTEIDNCEIQKIYLEDEFVLYCLYFGDLIGTSRNSQMNV